MTLNISQSRLVEIWRYYQAAVINTAFGLGMYFLLVWLGMNMFAAQLISHCLGVAFNYITYSRHVFRGTAPAKLRFVASYALNYLLGLATLAAASVFITSPYLAGVASTLTVSVINYFALKHLVFRTKPA